jgi:hypothetical protein
VGGGVRERAVELVGDPARFFAGLGVRLV